MGQQTDDNDNDSKDEDTFNEENLQFKISDKHNDYFEDDHIFEIDFENVLHNSIFIKRKDSRNIRSILDDGEHNNSSRMGKFKQKKFFLVLLSNLKKCLSFCSKITLKKNVIYKKIAY